MEFHRHAQFHITTPQRVVRFMHYSPTLWHITAQAVFTGTLAEEVHRIDLQRSAQTLTYLSEINNTASFGIYICHWIRFR